MKRYFFCGHGLVAFRVGPWWVKVRDTRKSRPLFSERNGYVPTCKVGWLMLSAARMLP